MAMPARMWHIPEGLKVRPDGSWRIGDGTQRMPVELEGPPFEVVRLVIDGARGAVRAVLDDGSEETVREDSLGMYAQTGRFHCLVRDGRAQAVLSRAAHQTLLAHAGQDGGRFYLQAGERRLPVRA